MTKEVLPSICIKNYLQNNIGADKKILISISCGLDSTVLFDLIIKSKYFYNKNIYYLIFDHQMRSEGKYEIQQFIKSYKLNKNVFIKKLYLKDKFKGFQEKSRSARYDFLHKFAKKRNIKDIFLGHHLDDLNETFFLRKIQQSSTPGLSNIFLKKYKDIKLHRPLIKYSKKQIKSYSNKNKLIWFEDLTSYFYEDLPVGELAASQFCTNEISHKLDEEFILKNKREIFNEIVSGIKLFLRSKEIISTQVIYLRY